MPGQRFGVFGAELVAGDLTVAEAIKAKNPGRRGAVPSTRRYAKGVALGVGCLGLEEVV
jgi:hypothetical protein